MPVSASLFAGLLLPGMLLFLEIGRRIGRRHCAVDPKGAMAGTGVIRLDRADLFLEEVRESMK